MAFLRVKARMTRNFSGQNLDIAIENPYTEYRTSNHLESKEDKQVWHIRSVW